MCVRVLCVCVNITMTKATNLVEQDYMQGPVLLLDHMTSVLDHMTSPQDHMTSLQGHMVALLVHDPPVRL